MNRSIIKLIHYIVISSLITPICIASFVISNIDHSIQPVIDQTQHTVTNQRTTNRSIRLDRVENTQHFNPFSPARGLSPDWTLLYDTLLSPDSRQFGQYQSLIASEITLSHDKKNLIISLQPDARFENGDPITADDVRASILYLIRHGPINYHHLADEDYELATISTQQLQVKSATAFTLQRIIQLGTLPITQKASLRNQSPVWSGAYKVSDHKLKRFAILTRQDDYWAKRLAARNHLFQFKWIKLIFLKNRHTAFELFRRGEIDFRWEELQENWHILNQIKRRNQSLNLKEIKHNRPAGMSGLAFNQKRKILRQVQIREALARAFHFDEINQSLFQGQYQRIESYFTNTPYATPIKLNQGFSLEEADQLLTKSGWICSGGIRKHRDTNKSLMIRILVNSISNEKIANIYAKNLKFLGIQTHIERANSADYIYRLQHGDFDLAYYAITTNPYTENNILAPFQYHPTRHYNFAQLFHIQNIELDEELKNIDSREKNNQFAIQKIDSHLMKAHLFIPFWRPSVDRLAHWNSIDGPNESFTSRPRDFYRWWWPSL